MTHHRIARFGMCLAAVALLAGCAGSGSDASFKGPSPDGGGQISLALTGDYVAGTTYFKIRLYKKAPASLDKKAYFESPCTPPNLGFTVTDLDVATDYVVVYDAYSTADCAAGTLAARGIRGGVDVTKAGTGNAVYYIQVNPIGGIGAFPVPDADLLDSGVACQADADCQATTDCPDPSQCRFPFQQACAADETCANGLKWMQYVVHPQAKCMGSTCSLQTLFPLNVQSDRAFHVAVSGPGGDVVMAGGYSLSGSSGLTVSSATTSETFGASSSLFDVVGLGTDLGNAVGLMGSVLLGGQQLVLIGGASVIGVEVDGDSTVPFARPQQCSGTCPLTISPYAFVVDLVAGTATRSQPGFSTALPLVEAIDGDNGPEAYVRAGLIQAAETPDRISAGRSSYRCVPGAAGDLQCVVVPGSESATARYAATSACVQRNATGGCTDIVVLGGNVSPTAAFGEWYSKATGQVKDLSPIRGVPDAAFGAIAVVANGQVWTFGGASLKNGRTPDIEPMSWVVDTTNGTLYGAVSGLAGADLNLLLRTHHQATPLADGKTVLITGGLGPDRTPLSSAVLVAVSDVGQLSVTQLGDMAVPRIDHRTTLIQGGLLNGAVLITGGLSNVKAGVKFAKGAEIFLP